MLPVDVKEDNSQKKNTAKKRGQLEYICFDFECTQEHVLEYEQGNVTLKERMANAYTVIKKSWCGTFQHRPNL